MEQNRLEWRKRVAKDFDGSVKSVATDLLKTYSINSAASIMGISPHTLRRFVARENISFEHKKQPPDRKPYVAKKPHTRVRLLTLNGVTKPLGQWAEHLGVERSSISYRLDRMKMSVEQALTIPLGSIKRKPPERKNQTPSKS